MAKSYLQSTSAPSEPERTEGHLVQLAKNVHVYKAMTTKSFLECLGELDVTIASQEAGLVVVDSIASLVRKEFDISSSKGAVERTSSLLKQSARLK